MLVGVDDDRMAEAIVRRVAPLRAVALGGPAGDVFEGTVAGALPSAQAVAKRLGDVVLSALALVLLLPFCVLVALAIKLDSPGPVLFRQRRVGRFGEEFEMFKLRTMVEGAHVRRAELHGLNEAAAGLFKIAADPRRTRVGRVLRRLHLDELPQLWHVLTGRMSLVGPRPLLAEEDDRIPAFLRRERASVRPGVTGVWQVGGGHGVTIAEMAVLDAAYVEDWSLRADARIALATLRHVLAGRGK